ncbi:MAG: heterodisulfide reductase-related iron-sulfur binding cluster [Bacteroidota bacterium]|nr:heterodisulfide reductase-related iron-sulfur binding cluster [Bacteroidota bacterium]
MGIKNFIFIVVFLAAMALIIYNVRRLISYLMVGQKEDRFDNIGERIKNVLKIAFGQSKLLRDPVAGTIHFLIFWGFMLFLFAVIESLLQGFYSPFSLRFLGPIYSLITITQDIFGVFVIISVLAALYRRLIVHVPRLEVGHKGKMDAVFILCMILVVVLSMFGMNIASLAVNNFALNPYEVRPLSAAISPLLFSSNSSAAPVVYEICWWIHIVFVLSFLNFLPYSKHLHVLSSIPNVFFSRLKDKRNFLKKLNLEDENAESFGVADIEHLTWKQMLDGYTCTECGRCTAVCPAANTGKLLSPRKIMVDIRKRTVEKAPLLIAGPSEDGNEENKAILEKHLVHDFITPQELWACTTCMACVQECPVMIEHVDAIVDMRRNLVLTESDFPSELNPVFKNLETNFTPWAFNWQDRANWAEGMNIKTMAEDPNGEYLFWVGCAGSFDSRYQKVTKAFATLMQKANIDFRILGTEEKCNGDTARRLGNEYLAQMMMMENVETLNNYGVKKIVTACPHCYNSLKKDFKQFGGNFEVKHHSELISEMLDQGKLELKQESTINKVTFHDSCYLGRYNGIFDSPRNSLNKIKGLELVEMKRNKDRGFCCGAGGGRMFLEETEGTRINVERTREALETNAETIASACPFCMTMLTDGVKAFDKADDIAVKDISEIVLENIK